EVGPAEEAARGTMGGSVAVVKATHLAEARRPDRPGAEPDRDRPAAGDLDRRGQRLIVPGPGVMRPLDGRDASSLLDDDTAVALPVRGRRARHRFETAADQLGSVDPDGVPEDLLPVDHAFRGFLPRTHQGQGDRARSGWREPDGHRSPALIRHEEVD